MIKKKIGLRMSTLALGVIIGCSAFAGSASTHSSKTTDVAMHVVQPEQAHSIYQKGSFELDMAPEKALPLFTGPGEELWIPPWKPVYLKGDGFEKGTVFITVIGGKKTHWLVQDYNVDTLFASYIRVIPNELMK